MSYKNKMLKWAAENPMTTGSAMTKLFTIDGIQPMSYVARVLRLEGRVFERKEEMYQGNGMVRYLYPTEEIINHAIEAGLDIDKAKAILKVETADKRLEEDYNFEKFVRLGKQSINSDIFPDGIRGNRFLTESEIVATANYHQHLCGIYFLVDGGHVVYVGQSVNVPARIGSHQKEGLKKFTRTAWIPCPSHCLDLLETIYIIAIRPKYNGGENRDARLTVPLAYSDIMNPQYFSRPTREEYLREHGWES